MEPWEEEGLSAGGSMLFCFEEMSDVVRGCLIGGNDVSCFTEPSVFFSLMVSRNFEILLSSFTLLGKCSLASSYIFSALKSSPRT